MDVNHARLCLTREHLLSAGHLKTVYRRGEGKHEHEEVNKWEGLSGKSLASVK